MKEEWLMPGAFVPVDVETTSALLAEIRRLIGVTEAFADQLDKERKISEYFRERAFSILQEMKAARGKE